MSTPGTSNIPTRPHKWHFTKQEILKAKTVTKDHWTPAKELDYRQRATRYIQEMVDKLNEAIRDKPGKVTQLYFKYQDIAAACLFLAGKSEESPKKLDHIVHVWWTMKFPKYRGRFPADDHKTLNDAKNYIVLLENIVLQTIAFDLKIDLPHPLVLNLTSKSIGHVLNDHGNKKLTECAYFFATDVLCVTNWAIRYSAAEIAVCCVDIVCHFGRHEIPKRPDGLTWYNEVSDISKEKLEEMEQEFIKIYQSCKYKLALHKFAAKGIVHPPQQCELDTDKNDDSILPPPPPPPLMPSLNDCKERDRKTSPQGDPPVEKPRKSFIPDLSIPPSSLGLPSLNFTDTNLLPPSQDKHREERREDKKKDKDRKKDERRKDERTEEKDRRREDERRRKDDDRRKREHSKISGHLNEESHGYKKPKQDYVQKFIPASDNLQPNGHHREKDLKREVRSPMSYPLSMKVQSAISPPRAPYSLSGLVQSPISPPAFINTTKGELEEGEVSP